MRIMDHTTTCLGRKSGKEMRGKSTTKFGGQRPCVCAEVGYLIHGLWSRNSRYGNHNRSGKHAWLAVEPRREGGVTRGRRRCDGHGAASRKSCGEILDHDASRMQPRHGKYPNGEKKLQTRAVGHIISRQGALAAPRGRGTGSRRPRTCESSTKKI
jgi:hypothetical protein